MQGATRRPSSRMFSMESTQMTEDELLTDNDEHVQRMRGSVGTLNHISIAIREELQHQDVLIDRVRDQVSGARDMVKHANKVLDRAISEAKSQPVVIVLVFVFMAFFLLWIILKLKRAK